MINIAITDDEKLIRAGIRKILSDSIDIPVNFFECKNGEEAFELCRTEQIDLLITDIRMPKMDGIELMRQVSEIDSQSRPSVIVLSGFDDFSYAKAALSYGALTYILKPVDRKELVEAVNKAIEISRQKEQHRNELVMQSFLRGEVARTSDTSLFANGLYCVAVSGDNPGCFFENTFSPGEYYVLEKKKNYVTAAIPKSAGRKIQHCESCKNPDPATVSLRVGVSSMLQNPSEIQSAQKNAFVSFLSQFLKIEPMYVFCGGKLCSVYMWNTKPALAVDQLDHLFEQLLGRLELGEAAGVQKSLNAIFDLFEPEKGESAEKLEENYAQLLYQFYVKIQSQVLKSTRFGSDQDVYLKTKALMIENIWIHSSLSEWRSCVSDYLVYSCALKKRGRSAYPFINEALEYLNSHFTKNINMATVANEVSVNYTWFSEKFTEHTGLHFNEYLKKLRIQEAKRLLAKGCYKVYEVSNLSGFGDVKYFMKTFREETGVTPTEYKKLSTV